MLLILKVKLFLFYNKELDYIKIDILYRIIKKN